MQVEPPTIRSNPFGVWLISLFVLGAIASVAVLARYDEFLDCSNPEIHQSASTPLGWTAAIAATVIPMLVGIVLGVRRAPKLVTSPWWLGQFSW